LRLRQEGIKRKTNRREGGLVLSKGRKSQVTGSFKKEKLFKHTDWKGMSLELVKERGKHVKGGSQRQKQVRGLCTSEHVFKRNCTRWTTFNCAVKRGKSGAKTREETKTTSK